MIRVRLETSRFATVHLTPSRWQRWFGATEQDFEVWQIAELGGRQAWVTHDNRPVALAVADAIEAELTRSCVADRLKDLVRT